MGEESFRYPAPTPTTDDLVSSGLLSLSDRRKLQERGMEYGAWEQITKKRDYVFKDLINAIS